MQTIPKLNTQSEESKIIDFIKSTFAKAGKTKAIVAVSGGIDSATSLALAAKALGSQNVYVLTLPSAQTEEKHLGDAQKAADHAQIPEANRFEINLAHIQDSVATSLRLYTQNSNPLPNDRLGNIAARLRMTILFDQAKALDALVVGTENKSEDLLGYFTRYGDQGSDLEPIKHLYKAWVYELALHLGVPESIITKAPTAGLWKDQTDETELGFSYAAADPILYFYFDEHKTKQEIVDMGYSEKLVNTVIDYTQAVDFKHQVPYEIN